MPRDVIDVVLPTFHPGQVRAFLTPGRFKVVRCGRRWGKTDYGKVIACDGAINGEPIGWFAPDYKRLSESYNEIATTLKPVITSSSKVDGVIRTLGGGRIDFWTLQDENAGRSRKYKHVLLDEAAFTKPKSIEIWRRSIRPTLVDLRGSATVMSNTNGISPDNMLWQLCNQPEHGFVEYHAPAHENPYLPPEELAELEASSMPLVWQQEYLAKFVDWSGVAFFAKESLLVDGAPIEMPARCECVFAILDTATKTENQHDGTGVTYYAIVDLKPYKLVVLDWSIAQIEGATLETWLPSVFARLQELAKDCRARRGSVGAFIEDKNSGSVLLQQAKNHKWPTHPIDSKLTAMGKSERALDVSGYVFRGLVKFATEAWNKVMPYKGVHRNHLASQIFEFRVGDEDAKAKEDDLLDTFTYGIALALGNSGGF